MKIPANEIEWVGYYDSDGNEQFVITSKPTRDYYFLYKISGKEVVKMGKAKNPLELENKYIVKKKGSDVNG